MIEKLSETYLPCKCIYRRAKRPDNRIGGQINTWIPLIDAHVEAIKSKFGSSVGPPTQLISIVLNMVPHKQKTELEGEVIRREEKT